MNDLDRSVLDLERRMPVYGKTKARAIHALDLRESEYYLILSRLAWSRDGIEYDPITCKRIQAQTRKPAARI